MNLDFELTADDARTVAAIVRRAAEMEPAVNGLLLSMDLTVCHNHAVALDFDGLLRSRVEDFVHDLNGIGEHLDRETGQLMDLFVPRYARRTQ